MFHKLTPAPCRTENILLILHTNFPFLRILKKLKAILLFIISQLILFLFSYFSQKITKGICNLCETEYIIGKKKQKQTFSK